jgi:plasmid stability protein
MNLTIELPDDLGAALKAQAEAHGVSIAGFTRNVLEQAVQRGVAPKLKPKKSGYGLLAQYGPGPSAQEIDDNRKEMFSRFVQDDIS